MAAMPTLPTEEELRKLPLRGIVAYAVRCGRRVQPLYRPSADLDEETLRIRERTLGLVHSVTLGSRHNLANGYKHLEHLQQGRPSTLPSATILPFRPHQV